MSKQTGSDDACARAEGCMPDYWQDELSSVDRAWLEKHLETCRECAELTAFWQELGQLPAVEADPRQRRRFDAMLTAYVGGNSKSSAPWEWIGWLRPLPVLALVLASLLAGLGGGWWLRGNNRSPRGDQAEEVAALREEVHATNELVVLSMLRQDSANDRLEGVSFSRRIDGPDPQIEQALLHSLQSDPSADVRLAALDELQRFGNGGGSSAAVARGLIEAFPYQKSPLLQVALVDSFLELRPPAARELLQMVSSNPAYSPEVRQRAAWGLAHWN